MDCQRYSSIRNLLFTKIEPSIPFSRLLSKETLLSHLMDSTDYFIIVYFAYATNREINVSPE